jgi:hypothetical protein
MRRHLRWGAACLFLIFGTALSPGQDVNNPAAQRAAMAKLDFLRGEWRGESWTTLASGPRQRAQGAETVQSKLGGLVLTIEGAHRGATAIQTGEIVHRAFAVISYDEQEKRYRLHAYTETGAYIDATARVTDRRLQWGIRVSASTQVRYTITVNDRGEWFEIAEVSRDGSEWRTVFEMTLQRLRAA